MTEITQEAKDNAIQEMFNRGLIDLAYGFIVSDKLSKKFEVLRDNGYSEDVYLLDEIEQIYADLIYGVHFGQVMSLWVNHDNKHHFQVFETVNNLITNRMRRYKKHCLPVNPVEYDAYFYGDN